MVFILLCVPEQSNLKPNYSINLSSFKNSIPFYKFSSFGNYPIIYLH